MVQAVGAAAAPAAPAWAEVTPGHGPDLAGAVERALGLMYQGVHEFETNSAKGIPPDAADAMEVIHATASNLGELNNVVRKFRRQETQEQEAAKKAVDKELEAAKQENQRLRSRTAELESTGKQLDAKANTLGKRAERCEASAKKRGCMGEADFEQVESLQRLVDELRTRLHDVTQQLGAAQGHANGLASGLKETESKCQDDSAKLNQQIAELKLENSKLRDTVAVLNNGEAEKRAELFKTARDEAANAYTVWKGKLEGEAKLLAAQAQKSRAVAQHLAEQTVGAQRDEAKLKSIVTSLQQQNADLKSDKEHLMDTLQSLLRQSTKYQQDLLSCEQGAREPDGRPAPGRSASAAGASAAPAEPRDAAAGAPEDGPGDGGPGGAQEDPIAAMGETTSIDSYIVSSAAEDKVAAVAGRPTPQMPNVVAAQRGLRGSSAAAGTPAVGATQPSAVPAGGPPKLHEAPVRLAGPASEPAEEGDGPEEEEQAAGRRLPQIPLAPPEVAPEAAAPTVRLASPTASRAGAAAPPARVAAKPERPAAQPKGGARPTLASWPPPALAAVAAGNFAAGGAADAAAVPKDGGAAEAAAVAKDGVASPQLPDRSLADWLGVVPPPQELDRAGGGAAAEGSGDAASKLMLGAEKELSDADDGGADG